jgi:ubiquinone/menaquinone biosynthesis C-methylase UbiE
VAPEENRASVERFAKFDDRDAALVRWRFGRGYVAELAERRYRKMFNGGRRILDVGCGVGEAAIWADGAEYFGIDLSPALLSRGRDLTGRAAGAAPAGRFLAAADVTRLPFPDAVFDRVTCMGVLHHLPQEQIPTALAEMVRVLVAGGEIAIIEPNPWSFFQRLMAYVRPAERGILATSPGRLRRLAEAVPGAAVERVEYDHTMFPPAHATFLLQRWAWVTGPAVTKCLRLLHAAVVCLTPKPLRSHVFFRLRKEGR